MVLSWRRCFRTSVAAAAVAAVSFSSTAHGLREQGLNSFVGHGLGFLWGDQRTLSHADEDGRICCCRSKHQSMCRGFGAKEYGSRCPSDQGYADYLKFMKESASWPVQCTKAAETRREKPKRVRVKVYWMRHGLSCANIIGLQGLEPVKTKLGNGYLMGKYRRLLEGLSEEPVLSNAAVDRAGVLGAIIRAKLQETHGEAAKKIPVFSSFMLRAMQTALLNFPGKEVQPLPYIAESLNWRCNYALSWDKQQERTAPVLGKEALGRVKFDICDADHPSRSGVEPRDDYDAFRMYFASFLEEYLREQGVTVQEGEEIPVVIVSHSEFMKASLKSCGSRFGRKPYNNEVWVQKYSFEMGAWDQELVEEGECGEFFPENTNLFPEVGLDLLCESELGNCPHVVRKAKDWINHDRAQCDAAGGKSMLEREWQARVPYTQEFDRLKSEGKISAEDAEKIEKARGLRKS